MRKVLLFVEGATQAGYAELHVAAHRLHGRSPYETYGVSGGDLGPDSAAGMVETLADLHREFRFDAIIFRGSHLAGMLAPRLAARLGAALVTEVVDIRRDRGRPAFVRRVGNGEVLVRIASHADGPLIVAIRPGALPGGSARREATQTLNLSPSDPHDGRVVLVGRRLKDPPGDIRDAEVLISGGGGVLGAFEELQTLAAALGGHVAASRRAVDMGVATRAIQVGQSGRTVSPRLYVALGIDGAGQHIEGLRNIEFIISVNTNRHAPICSISDIVVEGDAREFIDRLCRRIVQGRTAEPEGKHEAWTSAISGSTVSPSRGRTRS